MGDGRMVLTVDDDDKELDRLCALLLDGGYEPIPAEDLSSGLRSLYDHHPDAIVLGIDDIGSSHWSAIKRIREVCDTCIILITSGSTQSSLQKAFDLGLDGYLVKPVRPKQLLDRLAAAMRKTNQPKDSVEIFRHENLIVDWKRFEVWIDGRSVHLSPIEFRLLAFLVENRGWVVSYNRILSKVWGPDHIGDHNNVKLYVWYLRRKLEPDPSHPRWILTRYGMGYMFADESTGPVADGGDGTAPSHRPGQSMGERGALTESSTPRNSHLKRATDEV